MGNDVKCGGCLCGRVRYELTPPLRGVVVCHCEQCGRWSGHTVAATSVRADNFRLTSGASDVAWYRSSDVAERGFCKVCGSNLFWKASDGTRVSVMAGTLDRPTGLKQIAHIYVDDKSDYYAIDDGETPRHGQGGGPLSVPPGPPKKP
ncbi:MAG: GFA family protein [Rhizobiales bacterium]|nr:GFA family protein [Hyphomicrobiales bacterium]